MAAAIDAFTSPTLKHLRESWWDDQFTEFLAETLRPRPGKRILDVGSGEGLAEVALGRLHISQMRLVGIDLAASKVAQAREATRAHNQRVGFAAADACRLPFVDGAFDALFGVAVLQHIGDVASALSEFARVTAEGGRIVAVEPDNDARYLFSAVASGRRAFELGSRFFRTATSAHGARTDTAIGPKLPGLFSSHGIEPVEVRLFPVSSVFLGPPPPEVWDSRRAAIDREMRIAPSDEVRDLGRASLDALRAYEHDAGQAGASFVEIQNTMLFATVGTIVSK